MKALIEELKTQVETLITGLRWYEENHPEIWNGADDEAVAESETLIKKADEALAGHLLPLDDDLKGILGRMCFQCAHFAQILRLDGHDIPTKAEDEQAHAIHWMLGHYLKAGKDWRISAQSEMKEIKARHYAKQAELAK